MLALCAAIGSFHVKSPTTYFVMVTMTVRVLPFFLSVTLIRSGTFIVSTLGVPSYSDQRYSSMQISATRHSLGVSTGRTAGFRYSFPGSDVNRDASCPRFSGGGVGRESGKGASRIATSVTETPSSPIAVACGASMGSAPAVADVAGLPSIGAPMFSMGGDSKPRSPAATQPARTTVPHTANAASRRGLITSSLPVSSRPHPDPCCIPMQKRVVFLIKLWPRKDSDQNVAHSRKKTAGYHLFRNVLPECNPILGSQLTAAAIAAPVVVFVAGPLAPGRTRFGRDKRVRNRQVVRFQHHRLGFAPSSGTRCLLSARVS